MSKIHAHFRKFDSSPDGRGIWAFGARVGWWPCLRAPFIQLALGRWRWEAWYGLPSYKVQPARARGV